MHTEEVIIIKIMMHGCCGHMGQVISELVEKDPEAEITVGVDIADKGNTSYPVYTDLSACQEDVDVVIDFSSAKAVDALLDYCGERNLPLVLCTTGLSEEQLARVEETAKKTAVLKSANMSLGINTLLKLIQEAARVLATAGFDMEIVERHHRLKLDAPAELLLRWQTVSMKLWAMNINMFMTAARREKCALIKKLVSLLDRKSVV